MSKKNCNPIGWGIGTTRTYLLLNKKTIKWYGQNEVSEDIHVECTDRTGDNSKAKRALGYIEVTNYPEIRCYPKKVAYV